MMTWHLDPDTALIGHVLLAAVAAAMLFVSLRQSNRAHSEYDDGD